MTKALRRPRARVRPAWILHVHVPYTRSAVPQDVEGLTRPPRSAPASPIPCNVHVPFRGGGWPRAPSRYKTGPRLAIQIHRVPYTTYYAQPTYYNCMYKTHEYSRRFSIVGHGTIVVTTQPGTWYLRTPQSALYDCGFFGTKLMNSIWVYQPTVSG